MTDNKSVMQLALDALIEYEYAKTDTADRLGVKAISALREAIRQEKQSENHYEL